MGSEFEGTEEDEKRPKPRKKFSASNIARTTSFNVEVAATGITKCKGCFKRVEQGEARLVIKATVGRFLQKVGLCNQCSFDVVQIWRTHLHTVLDILETPLVRCPKCKDHGPMKWSDGDRNFDKLKPGWVCGKGHRFARLKQILWPPRKRV